MKKFLVSSLVVAMAIVTFLPTASADRTTVPLTHPETIQGTTNPFGAIHEKRSMEALRKAVIDRYKRYFNQKNAVKGHKNIYQQRLTHSENLDKNNTTQVQTEISRTGELETKEQKARLQPNSSYQTRSNWKQVFRQRVKCYYLDGNAANKDCLKADTVDGMQNRVQRYRERQISDSMRQVNIEARFGSQAAVAPKYSEEETANRPISNTNYNGGYNPYINPYTILPFINK